MNEALSLFLAGTALGATAGLSPGPLQALVLGETLRYSIKQGLRASLAPLLTDPPIVLLTIAVLAHLADFDRVMVSCRSAERFSWSIWPVSTSGVPSPAAGRIPGDPPL